MLNALSASVSQGIGRDAVFIGEREYIDSWSDEMDTKCPWWGLIKEEAGGEG